MPFVPDRIASNIATPNFSIDTPKAAFGGAWADAMQSAGAEIKGAGNELFARAQAMQELQNRTDANDKTTQFMIESGKLHADYQTKLGKDAVEAFPEYQQKLQALRDDIGGSVKSPMARKMYDSETKSTMGRTLFNAAGHAATEQKRWMAGSSEARIEAAGNQALVAPEDDVGFQKELQTVKDEVDILANIKGFGEDQYKQELASRTSNLWVQRIKALSDRKPETARQMLSDAVSKGSVQGEDIAKTTNYVNQRLYSVGSRHISDEVASGEELGKGKVGTQQARGAISSIESGSWGGNYSLLGPEVFKKDGSSRGRALGRYQVMPENLPEWLAQAGLPSMTPAEFLKNPKAQDAVFDKVFGDYMEKYGNFNDAASKWFTGRTASEAIAAGANDKYTSIQGYLQKTNAALGRMSGLSQKEELGRQRAREIAPDDPIFEDHVVDRIRSDHAGMQRSKAQDELVQRQTIDGALLGVRAEGGKLPTTVEELRAQGPEVAVAWDNLTLTNPAKAQQYLNAMARNAKGDRALTREGLAKWQQLKGMAQTDPKAFLEQNILEENLPIGVQKELANLQFKMKDKASGDPRVLHALSLLRPMLGDILKDKDSYNQFAGALQDQLQDYQDVNKKPADAKTVNEIGARLLQQKGSPNFWWGTDYMYKLPVPEADDQRIRALPAWSELGIQPTPEQVQRVFTREQYQKLYGGTPKAEAKPGGPQVPISR